MLYNIVRQKTERPVDGGWNKTRKTTKLIVLLLFLGDCCNSLRLTNMTAPALQDPRRDMELHCRFDMGGEELYAVKWYKDDHEFFRYTPAGPEPITKYPVDGVEVELARTQCMPVGCDLLLTRLSRPHSSGAYRCEVSSEAPAFRLASQTHNVTVAAIPYEKPRIEGLDDSYNIGAYIKATCTSGLGDPKPALAWYIDDQQITSKGAREIPSSAIEDKSARVRLLSTQLRLNHLIDKKLMEGLPRRTVNFSCVSSIDGLNRALAPPLIVQKSVTLLDSNLVVKNQKLHSPFNAGTTYRQRWLVVVVSCVIKIIVC